MARFGLRTTATCSAVLVMLAGCTGGDSDADPQDAADSLATALSEGDVSSITFSGTPSEEAQSTWVKITSGMGDNKPEVTVDSVDEQSDTATATMKFSWSFGESDDATWTYETEATLHRSGDEWQPEWSPALVAKGLEKGESLDLTAAPAERGKILGANNATIVKDRPVRRVGINKVQVGDARVASSARRLAKLLDINVGDYVKKVKSYGPKAFVEAIVLRKEDAAELDSGTFASIKGATQIQDTMPLAPTSEFAEPVLGSVGPATAELIEESDGELEEGDVTGLSGLQERYDERLRGESGIAVEAVSSSGNDRELFSTEPTDGKKLRTTLDVNAQRIAESALGNVKSPSAVVAIEPSTGNVLAAASGSGSDGYTTATYGQYAPGSTFKVVTSLAMLRNGYSPGDTLTCAPTVTVDGYEFKNYDDYPTSELGKIPMRTAIAESCNTALIGEQKKISQSDLADAAASLGLGEDHDTGFTSFFGEVPAKAGSRTGHAASMIGQGKVQASPLAMALVAASVADGSTVVPTLVQSVKAEKPTPDVKLRGGEAKKLRSLMRGVVDNGSASFLADVPGQPIGAKTGTAEYGDASRTHAWMIAFRGDLAVAVFVENGKSGSGTAGPILEKFLRSYQR